MSFFIVSDSSKLVVGIYDLVTVFSEIEALKYEEKQAKHTGTRPTLALAGLPCNKGHCFRVRLPCDFQDDV